MNKILIFAGTSDGRNLAEYLNRQNIPLHVCVATEYGEKLLPKGEGITITSKRLNSEEMKELILHTQVSVIVDATHPFAVEVTENIKIACKDTETEYIRLLRPVSNIATENCIWLDNIEAAVEYLKETKGNILITTGSKELSKFAILQDKDKRCFARVLSSPDVIETCRNIGFEGKNLICMQGPFCEEFNYGLLKQINANYMVTKESGINGGFEEKINAARRAGVQVLIIGRPKEEEGYSYEECLTHLMKGRQIEVSKKITLIGIGLGSIETMTMEAVETCRRADIIIGAKRMIEALKDFHKAEFISYKAEEIIEFIDMHPKYEKVVIALSGDVGFYSGAKLLMGKLDRYQIKVLPGISSLVYLCAKLHMPWENIKLTSIHGREDNIIAAIKDNTRVFSLMGGEDSVKDLCQKLINNGLEDVKLWIGEELSYINEKISQGTPKNFLEKNCSKLSVVLIENDKAGNRVIAPGIPDEEFVRGNVPMTKEEIRSISLSKLKLHRDSVLYDIGAGTGSISIEAGLQTVDGKVFAVEKNPEAIMLIEDNKRKFGVENIITIPGTAPRVLEELPPPTHGFIGGSSGNLREILNLLIRKNPKVRVVINAITLETFSETMECIKSFGITDAEVLQVFISKAKKAGDYHLMMGQNPIYIISFTGGEYE